MIESELSQKAPSRLDSTNGHWGMRCDPFQARNTAYVDTPSHRNALAILSDAIDSGEPIGTLLGESGTGKTTVLNQLTLSLRRPNRRIVQIPCPLDGSHLISNIAASLGIPNRRLDPVTNEIGMIAKLRSIEQGFRVRAMQKNQVVLIVDDCRHVTTASEAPYLKRILDQARACRLPLTLILATDDQPALRDHAWLGDALASRLGRLTRSESENYLGEKLRLAGRYDVIFSPNALTRIHAMSGGIPRTLDRLASASLRLGASKGVEVVTPDLVDALEVELFPAIIR